VTTDANGYSVQVVSNSDKAALDKLAKHYQVVSLAALEAKTIRQADEAEYQGVINDNAIILDETIVAIVKPTERLLHILTK
tara:strand:- start:555 stop:797 length:243 start_codon:yes stop_codon:yes gene_type:complete